MNITWRSSTTVVHCAIHHYPLLSRPVALHGFSADTVGNASELYCPQCEEDLLLGSDDGAESPTD